MFDLILGGLALYAVKKFSDYNKKDIELKREQNSEIFSQKIIPEIKIVKNIIKKQGYLSSSVRNDLEEKYNLVKTLNSFKDKYLNNECKSIKHEFMSFISNYNLEFIKKEKQECRNFFQLGKYSLDDEQQTAVITDEDNNLVIAGAGSGKTLTIMGKVNYLVDRKKVNPNDILLIAFANKAAEEMSSRIRSLDIDITAQTFHKLGLDIITKQRECRPKIAEEDFLHKFLIDYFVNKVKKLNNNRELFNDLVKYFAFYLNIPPCLEDFNSLGEMYDYEKNLNLETLKSQVENLKEENLKKEKTIKGEYVKSLQEVEIANYLFLNGIEYDYERPYLYKVTDKTRKEYTPDFCIYIKGRKYPNNCIWLEHFGINNEGRTPWLSEIEEKKYLDGIEWKRTIHKDNNTILEETYSYEVSAGVLDEKLNNILQKYSIKKRPVDASLVYNSLLSNVGEKYFQGFIEFCSTFINLFKSSGYKIEDIDNLVYSSVSFDSSFHRRRKDLFKRIIKNIITEYEKALIKENAIDFSDMIIEATEAVENGFNLPKYKYVIIDEFQDISDARSKLIKAILDQTKARLFCVGDDWQSIYRFAGSDVGIFLEFENYFGATSKMNISNTYRNSQELIDVASNFIQKNPYQIKKNLYSNKRIDVPLRFYMHSGEKVFSAIEQAIEDFIKDNTGNNLLILGRTNYDKELLLKSTLFTIKNNKLIYRPDFG